MSARPPSIARASAIIAAGNIASRVLGLGREVVLSNLFGASRALEAFNNAVLVTRSLFDLLIAGHVNSAIVPVLSEIDSKHGRDPCGACWRRWPGSWCWRWPSSCSPDRAHHRR
ncbi:MAG: hypothetical protein IPM16_12210 [Chloroflexi bacterium]|nr:hypothetical protein [Chloroflexota bacterium]